MGSEQSTFIVSTTLQINLKMKIQVLMFLAILLIDAELVFGQLPCECNSLELFDANSNQNIGGCLTAYNGRHWCYVNSNSGCTDTRFSSRGSQLKYSFDACQGQQAQTNVLPKKNINYLNGKLVPDNGK